MESLAWFFGFILICACLSGAVSLAVVLLLRSRVRDLELRIQHLALNLSDLQRGSSAPARATAAVPVQPRVEAPPAAPRPVPAREEQRPEQPAPVSVAPPRNEPVFSAAAPKEATLESIENLVGTRWLNWIGAVVVLVGIAFLLKYLYDRGWIGPAGRVGIGLAFGVGLLVLGEVRLRRIHDLLSQSVSAAGCGALFLTTFLAFKFYDFSGRLPTFLLLCWFAGFTVILAVIRNGRILAYLGLLGAYLTPYLLSTGQDQAESLFCYLAALALAASYVNATRGWSGIPSLCAIQTCAYYAAWYSRFNSPQRLLLAAAGAGGVIVFLGTLSLARALMQRVAVRMEECIVLLGSALIGVYYLWDLLAQTHPAVLGFILCGTALACLAGLRACRLRQASDDMVENELLGLAAGALLLVIPACLEASGAMLAWALAAVVLTDIGIRSRRLVLGLASALALLATLVVGVSEPVKHTGLFQPVFNRVFVAWFGAALAWFLAGMRCSRAFRDAAGRRLLGPGLQVVSYFMLLALLSYETAAWFAGRLDLQGADSALLRDWRTVALCVLWALYPAILLRWAGTQPKLWYLAAAHYAVMGVGLLVLLGDFHRREVLAFLNPVFLSALLFPAGVFMVSRRLGDAPGPARNIMQVYGHVLGVILLSVELYQGLFLSADYDSSRYWMRMALVSVAWAIYATAVLAIGITRNLPVWRWLALGLLGLTLAKVILLDMAEVRQIWRVLSFLVLGALLMACSYAYSRRERKRKAAEPRLEVSR